MLPPLANVQLERLAVVCRNHSPLLDDAAKRTSVNTNDGSTWYWKITNMTSHVQYRHIDVGEKLDSDTTCDELDREKFKIVMVKRAAEFQVGV